MDVFFLLLSQESLFGSYFPLSEVSSNIPLLKKCIINEELNAATTKPPARKEEVNPPLAKLRFLQHFILCSIIMILFKYSECHFHSAFSVTSRYSFLSTDLQNDRAMRGKYLIYLFIY